QDRVGFLHCARRPSAMRVLPWALARVHVILDVLDVLPALEQQHLEALLGQLLGGPAAGDAGAHDDGFVFFCRHCDDLTPGMREPANHTRRRPRDKALPYPDRLVDECSTSY